MQDDTLPGGPREKTITYLAPRHLPDREQDYRVAWEVFTKRFDGDIAEQQTSKAPGAASRDNQEISE